MKQWTITGVAGFIGSHLLETLLLQGERVIGLDDLSSGREETLEQVKALSGKNWNNFQFIKGDIRSKADLKRAVAGSDYVLHQAAMASTAESFSNPERNIDVNITGFLRVLEACRDNNVKHLVYASSCAVYGDEDSPSKREDKLGNCLSPYAMAKRSNELYAHIFNREFGVSCTGLRYFNIYGPRQSPTGAYAAVVPKWAEALHQNEPVMIFGDGETSRDFCFVGDVVSANLTAAQNSRDQHDVFNIGSGKSVTLNELFSAIKNEIAKTNPAVRDLKPKYGEFRKGDIRLSQADVSKAKKELGFSATTTLSEGLQKTLAWWDQQ